MSLKIHPSSLLYALFFLAFFINGCKNDFEQELTNQEKLSKVKEIPFDKAKKIAEHVDFIIPNNPNILSSRSIKRKKSKTLLG